MGADIGVNTHKENPVEKIMEITNGRGVDAVLECIGSSEALLDAFKIVRPAGRISFAGLFVEPVPIPMLDFYLKDLTLKAEYARQKTISISFFLWSSTARLTPPP
jgi:threonine dehydrogenase-like Zn-dependent dehydrogenase